MSKKSPSTSRGIPDIPPAVDMEAGAAPIAEEKPAASAYIPGEFEYQEAVTIGCAQLIRNFPQVFVNLVRAIHRHVRVVCLVNEADEMLGRILLTAGEIPSGAVDFVRLPSVSMWARDWSPLSGFDREGKRRFLGFELRHLRTSSDVAVRPELERLFDSPIVDVPLTHEGGNILCNGDGLCLTSTTVLLKNAGRQYDARRIAEVFGEYFGVKQWAYLDPLSGEPTGHVDLFCAFVDVDKVVVGEFDPKSDSINASLLDRAAEILSSVKTSRGPLQVYRVPMPEANDGKYRSYTNLLFANGVVVVPLFPDINDEMDRRALAIYKELMPDRDVIGLDISELSILGGGLHCLTSNIVPATRAIEEAGIPEPEPLDESMMPVESAGLMTA
ncbi:MAG: agmatine deiminase family protein [Verrucomicrobiae bacterium]|nr:agmatine deiminase family protein [Verrucomicrobiae bacterium]